MTAPSRDARYLAGAFLVAVAAALAVAFLLVLTVEAFR